MQTAIVSYRRQADQSGDLDPTIRQFLDRIIEKETPESIMAKLVAFDRGHVELKAGTILSREWNGTTHRAILVEDGFLWNGARYDSLSAIAFAITGTRWITDSATDAQAIATRERCSLRHVNMTLSLAFLSPALTKAAIEGRLPRGIGLEQLRELPLEWDRQFEALALGPM